MENYRSLSLLFLLVLPYVGLTQDCTSPRVEANFVLLGNDICEGSLVTIENTSNENGNIGVLYAMNWGDGNIDTVMGKQNISHIYSFTQLEDCENFTSVAMDLRLDAIVTNCPNNSHWVGKPAYIKLFPRPRLDTDSKTLCYPSTQLEFINRTCPAGEVSYFWDFDDPATGSQNTSTEEEPTHNFSEIGTYNVKLITQNVCGVDSIFIPVQVIEGVKADADFSVADNNGCVPLTLKARNRSEFADKIEWSVQGERTWEFADNTNATSDEPVFRFTGPGLYTVKISASGCNSKSLDTMLIIKDIPGITLDTIPSGCEDILVNPATIVTYRDTLIDSYQWTFPGQSDSLSSEAFPDMELLYRKVGDHLITVAARNECGIGRDTAIFTIDVVRAVSVEPVTAVCNGDQPFQLQATPPGGLWSGNGVSQNGLFSPSQARVGFNQIIYQVGEGNCAFSDTISIEVLGTEVKAGTDLVVCVQNEAFELTPADPAGGEWTGPGIIDRQSGLLSPSVAGIGHHDIVYTYRDPATGCLSRDQLSLAVTGPPEALLQPLTESCVGVPVNFRHETPNIQSVHWNFGDGAISDVPAPQHVYTAPGNYTIVLQVTDVLGCRDTASQSIYMEGLIAARFEPDPNEGCADLTVNIRNNSEGNIVHHTWLLDGELISNNADPTSILLGTSSIETTYTLMLVAEGKCNRDSIEKNIVVRASPITSFGLNKGIFCEGEEVFIGNNSEADSLFWDFGNGRSYSGFTPPPQTYFTNGEIDTATITMYAYNRCGIDTLQRQFVIVPTDATAFIGATRTTACIGDSLFLESFSTPRLAPVSWDFGDGNTAFGSQVAHSFGAAGLYPVVARVASCGYDADTVTIEVLPDPDLSLDAPSYGCVGEAVGMEIKTAAANVFVTLGDGQSDDRKQLEHRYELPGIYNLDILATSEAGCSNHLMDSITIFPLPQPAITLGQDTICAFEEVSLFNSGAGELECRWVFGDGQSGVGCHVTHAFTKAGTLALELTGIDERGCLQTVSRPIYIRSLPQPAFAYTFRDSCQRGLIQLENQSLLAARYDWDLGDGTTSNHRAPFHHYDNAGQYRIRLRAFNDVGCSQEISRFVEVYEKPTASFVLPGESACAPFNLRLENTSSSISQQFSWDLGDGERSSATDPVHHYEAPGVYEIKLVASTGLCADTASQELTIYPPLRLSTRSEDIACHGASTGSIEVELLSGTAPFVFQWSTGAEEQNLSGLPAGNYQLSVTDVHGCQQEASVLLEQPAAALSIDVLENFPVSCFGEADGQILVSARGGEPNYFYQWSNGLSGPLLSNVPAGIYQLLVTDTRQCQASYTLEIGDKRPLTIQANTQDASCFGLADGILDVNINGGSFPYTSYIERDGQTLQGNYFDQLPAGRYHITVFDQEDCQVGLTVEIRQPSELQVEILQADTTIALGNSLPLPIRHNQLIPNIQWSPETDLNLNDPERPVARPLEDRSYVVSIRNNAGCIATDTIQISVFVDRNIYIPNAFSPDGDGHNDVFTVRTDRESLSVEQINYMRIYDRWGELVFEQKNFLPNDYNFGWNGSFKGRLLAPDVYFYLIELKYLHQEEPVLFQGDVRLFY